MKITVMRLAMGIMMVALVLTIGMAVMSDNQRKAVAVQGRAAIGDIGPDLIYCLVGEWEFYPNALLTPDDFATSAKRPPLHYATLPKNWNSENVHWGTYRVLLDLPEKHSLRTYGLALDRICSAAKVFVNSTQLLEVGKVAANKVDYSPLVVSRETYFDCEQPQMQIIVQVADFEPDGVDGIVRPLRIGSAEAVGRWRETDIRARTITAFCFAFAVIIFTGLYWRQQRQSKFVFFVLFAFVELFWQSINGNRALGSDFFAEHFSVWQRLNSMGLFATQLLFYNYVIRALNRASHSRVINTAGISILVLQAFMPIDIIYRLFSFSILVLAAMLIVILFHCWRAIRERQNGSWYLGFGALCWAGACLDVLLYYYGFVWERTEVWLLTTFFVASQILFINDRYLQSWLAATNKVAAKNELNYLRSQISQHFVHNTLESVNALIEIDAPKAQELLKNFSDYLRYYYAFDDETEMVTLREELNLVNAYLAIESVRLGKRLRTEIDVAPECETVLLPPLSVQPLVENAIKHGIFPRRGGGCVKITAESNATGLKIVVDDDGVGAEVRCIDDLTNRKSEKSTGIGLSNVVKRLRRYAGATVEAFGNPGEGLKITIVIPAKLPDNEETSEV